MEQEANRKRKKSPIVEVRSQLYLSLQFILYLLVYSIVLILVILLPSALKFTIQSIPLEQQLEASREFLFLDRKVVPAIVVVAFLMAVHFLFVTHRIFGPLKRMRQVFLSWDQGRWPGPLSVRRKDFHQGLFKSFNKASGHVGRDLGRAHDLLSSSLEELEGGSGDEALEAKWRESRHILGKYLPSSDEKADRV